MKGKIFYSTSYNGNAMAIRKTRLNRNFLILALVFLLMLYVVLPQIDEFNSSWSLLKNPNYTWTALAVGLAALTYVFAALTYKMLAFSLLHLKTTVLTQVAAMFMNRLLPAGIGALGTNFVYLRKQKHTVAQAGTIVAINNLLGFMGHGLILAIVLLFFTENIQLHSAPQSNQIGGVLAVGAIVLLILGLTVWKGRISKTLTDVLRQILSYRHRKLRLSIALLSSMCLSLCNISALYACAAAVGIQLDFPALILVFTLGVSLGTAVPTPGGLGAFEAGLVAGFVAYGTDSSSALAAALLYRLITYWLAIAAGAVAFVLAQRKGYI